MNHPESSVENINIVGLHSCNAASLILFYKNNKVHLEDSMPIRDLSFYTDDYWNEQISQYSKVFEKGSSLRFILMDEDKVIGTMTFDQIVYGVFRSCYLGYSLDMNYQGKGIMTKSLQFGLDYVMNELRLNRVMANYVPQNYRSGKLLRRLGFEREGYARKYLMLNGEWKDHILTSLISDL